jgi:hypothetical protein
LIRRLCSPSGRAHRQRHRQQVRGHTGDGQRAPVRAGDDGKPDHHLGAAGEPVVVQGCGGDDQPGKARAQAPGRRHPVRGGGGRNVLDVTGRRLGQAGPAALPGRGAGVFAKRFGPELPVRRQVRRLPVAALRLQQHGDRLDGAFRRIGPGQKRAVDLGQAASVDG